MVLNDLLEMTVTEAAHAAAAAGFPLSAYVSHALLGTPDELSRREAQRMG